MNGSAFTWWENRKSRMGLKPSAKPPPWDPKKPWWTSPPVAPPEPEMMEYAIRFQAEMAAVIVDMSRTPRERLDAQTILAQLKPWITAARRLYHERVLQFQETAEDDLRTTEGIMVAAEKCMNRLRSRLAALGGTIEERDDAVKDALMRRNSVTKDRRAKDPRGGRR